MSKADIWMPLYIGDYVADTMHLSTEEHGAYLLLLMTYWRNAGPLPDDNKKLAMICRVSLSEFPAMRSALEPFFLIKDGFWINKRSDSEIKKWGAFKDDKGFGAAIVNFRKYGTPMPDKYAERYAERSSSDTSSVTPSSSPSPSPLTSSLPASSSASSKPDKVKSLPPAKPPGPKNVSDTELQTNCRTVWQEYSTAYERRYGTLPIRNAKINSAVKAFCQRIPASEAPQVAAWWVGHNGQRYGAGGHVFGLLLQDAEKIRTEWATNTKITTSQTRMADKTEGMGQVWKDLIIEAEERDNRGKQAIN